MIYESVCTAGCDTVRKRRRQTLEEDESMDEEEFGRLKSEADKDMMPDDFVLPEDLTGANLFV